MTKAELINDVVYEMTGYLPPVREKSKAAVRSGPVL